MKALAITSKGIEDISSLEIEEILGSKADKKKGCVLFSIKTYKDLCKVCYLSQSIEKGMLLLSSFSFKESDDLYKKLARSIRSSDTSKFLSKKTTFRASSKTIDNNEIIKDELNPKIGEMIIDKIQKEKKYNQKVNLETPDITFFTYIVKKTCYFGIDFSGFELHKRDYRVFQNPRSLRATIAYSLCRIARYKVKDSILDPFCGAGSILIEAALFASNMPINYYRKDKFAFLKLKPLKKIDLSKMFQAIDKKMKIKEPKTEIYGYDTILHYIQSARKNAKIAGINKQINFSKIDLDWIDVKFKEKSIDKIITQPPPLTRHSNPKEIEKIYNNLFYQAEYILKDKGTITLISRNQEPLKKSAERYKFKLKNERKVVAGKREMDVLSFYKC